MTTSRSTVVTALVLTGLGLSPRGAAQACPPAALLRGDGEAAAQVAALLRARGVATVAPPGCPLVHAELTGPSGHFTLHIDDARHAPVDREVASVEGAATLVESWSRADLAALLLPVPSVPMESLEATSSPAPEAARARPGAARRSLRVALGAEGSLASDGSLWLGGNLTGCVHLGRLCVGGVARASADAGVTGTSEGQETTRTAFDLLLTVELPMRVAAATLTPGLGFGAGWIRSASTETTQNQVEVDGGGLRAGAHAVLAMPVGRGLAIALAASADLSLQAHTGDFNDDQVTLTGEPRGFVRIGLGLQYGLP